MTDHDPNNPDCRLTQANNNPARLHTPQLEICTCKPDIAAIHEKWKGRTHETGYFVELSEYYEAQCDRLEAENEEGWRQFKESQDELTKVEARAKELENRQEKNIQRLKNFDNQYKTLAAERDALRKRIAELEHELQTR